MRYQDQVVAMTQRAVDDLFRTARAVPTDKLTWQPLDMGRSVLSQLQECATVPRMVTTILQERAMPSFGPEMRQKMMQERANWDIDQCETICRENTQKLCEMIQSFPEDDMGIVVHLPFGGGMELSLGEVMQIHARNTTYHTGQINYIQTLYGDTEMH